MQAIFILTIQPILAMMQTLSKNNQLLHSNVNGKAMLLIFQFNTTAQFHHHHSLG